MARHIVGLEWARPCARPKAIPQARLRGTRAQGLAFERALAKACPWARHGQWFEFADANGLGWCQPDLFAFIEGRCVVLEAKLTDVAAAREQLERLYSPILAHCFGAPVVGVPVVKFLSKCRGESPAPDLRSALAAPRPLLHWLGRGPFPV